MSLIDHKPYVSGDYLSSHFSPHEMVVESFTVYQDTNPVQKDEVEFYILLEGEGVLSINGIDFDIRDQQLILLLSYHVYSFSAPNGPIKFYRIHFSLGLLLLISTNRKMYYQELKSHEKLNPIVNLTQNQFKYVTTVTDSIYKELQSETEQKSYLSISLTSFLNYIYQKQRTNTNKLPTEKTLKWKVLQYMTDHHSMPLGIDMVAKQFDLSSGEVQQILQELTGTTFKNNMNRIRLRNAVALM